MYEDVLTFPSRRLLHLHHISRQVFMHYQHFERKKSCFCLYESLSMKNFKTYDAHLIDIHLFN
jgi:hypothetical protein